MLIRHGFVSNSSTTSFCVYGIVKDAKVSEKIEGVVGDAGLELFWGNPNDYHTKVYIGRSLCDIQGDETMNEFKLRITSAVETLFPGEGHTCGNYEEGYYDG